MKSAMWTKSNLVLVTSMMLMLMGGSSATALAQVGAQKDLTKEEIIQKAKDAYASLSTYSDEGNVVTTSSGRTSTTAFTIRLSRPNLYRIEWQESSPYFTRNAVVWSVGQGDFLNLDIGLGAQKQESQNLALGGATGVSEGAAANIPGTFFNMLWGGQLNSLMFTAERQADEKVGEVECYVLMERTIDRTRILLIGKQDFLIHQIRSTTSAEAVKATMDEDAIEHPQIDHTRIKITAITWVETHSNIVLNQKFSATDFVPSKVQ